MSRDLLIAPEWLGRSGLWLIDAKGRRQPVDAEEVGLSEMLADRLESWMDGFDAIYDEAAPEASRFPDERARIGWEAEGLAIAHAVAGELGEAWRIRTDFSAWQVTT